MRRLLIIVLIAVSVAVAVPPALAGGPTSVMITEPASGRATALYYTDSRYTDLEAVLATGEPVDGAPTGLRGGVVNLTWMVHDVEPWRTQQLYPHAAGGPLVVTYGSELMGDEAQASWSRVADGDDLAALLDRILRPGAVPATAAAEPPATDPVVIERIETETRTAWYSLAGWRWLVPGLLIGVTVALLAGGRRAGDADPRLMLTDVAPPGDERAPRAETLAR